MRLLLLSLVVMCLGQRSAVANCGCKAKVGPKPGDVPLRGSVYAEARLVEEGLISAQWHGQFGTSSWTVGSDVARLDYSGVEGSELVIMVGQYERAHYKLTSGWRRPLAAPRATQIEHEESSWTCASTDSLFITLDQQTAAVRVRWTHGGKTATWLEAVDGPVALGHNSCCGENLSPEELHDGGALELVAIHVDGTEARVTGLPRFVSANVYPPTGNDSTRWLRFLMSLGLIGAAVVVSRQLRARLS